ncbi:tyrosinase MelC2 [Amycolatopsis anabasis]|uniref:tyrosinase MelC2 n=1 Tax=Amycolatopsis anabasis TaxID=1840409 RepID=UPI00131D2905|nr:tyrosinase family protein [Amycolatopsis anabasis]
MGVRKNQANLTAAEKQNFVQAMLAMKRNGRYDPFVTTHLRFVTSDADNASRVGHRAPSFLPWHRQFLLEFERELQAIDPSVSLPYWDWTADRTTTSSLFAADFLGGDGRSQDLRVLTGPFAGEDRWPLTARTSSQPFLKRRFGGRSGEQLPTRAQVDRALAIEVYDQTPWNSASAGGFRNTLEGWVGPGLHNQVHRWIGGDMGGGASPNDPVFWLHHCFIDKLWADWQARHPASGYAPARSTRDVVALNEPMRPWNTVTPADLLDHTRYYTYA